METSVTRRPMIVQAVVVGVFAVPTSLFGLYYNATTALMAIRGEFAEVLNEFDAPYFYQAFAVMSAISVLCCVVVLVVGIDLLRSRLRWARLVSLVFLFELIYQFAIGALWLEPRFGRSIGAATGFANGGLMPQFLVLLPIWGPVSLWWGSDRARKAILGGKADSATQPPAVS
jgi:hypothetical protein